MRICALGRSTMLYDAILRLHNDGNEIILIIDCYDEDEDFKGLAEKLKCDYMKTRNFSYEVKKTIINKKLDIGISVNWRTIIPKEIINLFKRGIINAHAGDLPRYRGNAAPNWAIINKEKKIGLTLHLMDANLDSGAILLKRYMRLDDNTYFADIWHFIEDETPLMFVEVIKGLGQDKIKPIPQINKEQIRCYPRLPIDHKINWADDAKNIHRLIRASSEPLNGAYTFLGENKIIVWRGKYEYPTFDYLGSHGQVAERRDNGAVAVICGKGFLIMQIVEFENEGRKKASDIIKSIRTRLG